VSGFWHGASWNFIAWGFIHACGFLPLLLLNRNRKHVTDVVAQDRKLPNLKELWQMSTTFAFVTFAWIFFRADGMHFALRYIKQIGVSFYNNPTMILHPYFILKWKMAFVYIIPLVIGDWYLRRDERCLTVTKNFTRYFVYFILIAITALSFGTKSSFIYFQF
jgi:alginate O-acetyltransferase complex protein AlgI